MINDERDTFGFTSLHSSSCSASLINPLGVERNARVMGAGMAQWLERRARDRKVGFESGSGGITFFLHS